MQAPPRIIDGHVHIWDPVAHDYPFMRVRRDYQTFAGDTSAAYRPFLPQDLKRAAGGLNVEKIVHMEGHLGTADPSDESRWVQSVADAEGEPQGIVGFALLHSPGVETVLAGHAACPNARGIRHSVNWHADRFYSMSDRPDYLTDPDWRRGYGLLAKYDFSFDLQIYPDQLNDAADLARRFPEVPLILEHCAFPIDRTPEGLSGWRAGMRRLAEAPNTAVKLSGLVLLDHDWTRDSLAPIIRETVETFGPDRSLFASNFPIDQVYISYPDLVDAVGFALADLSAEDQDKVFYASAERLYRL